MLEGPRRCVLPRFSAGSLIIDNSTIAPAVARRLAARAAELGAAMIDAPVSGGEVGAINASLSIMIGGDEAAVGACAAGARSDGQRRAHRAHRRRRDRVSSARCATRW